MKFVCLAYEEQSLFDDMPRGEWDALRTETLEYVESLRNDGKLVDAWPLERATTATTLNVRDGNLSTTDGPYAETKEQLGGFFLIEAQDRDEAIAIAARWPSARFGNIEVRPVEEGLPEERRYA